MNCRAITSKERIRTVRVNSVFAGWREIMTREFLPQQPVELITGGFFKNRLLVSHFDVARGPRIIYRGFSPRYRRAIVFLRTSAQNKKRTPLSRQIEGRPPPCWPTQFGGENETFRSGKEAPFNSRVRLCFSSEVRQLPLFGSFYR